MSQLTSEKKPKYNEANNKYSETNNKYSETNNKYSETNYKKKFRGGNNERQILSVKLRNISENLSTYEDELYNLLPLNIRGLVLLTIVNSIDFNGADQDQTFNAVVNLFNNENVALREDYKASMMGYIITYLQRNDLINQFRNLN